MVTYLWYNVTTFTYMQTARMTGSDDFYWNNDITSLNWKLCSQYLRLSVIQVIAGEMVQYIALSSNSNDQFSVGSDVIMPVKNVC